MEQLIKKTEKGHSNVMPKSWIDAIIDKSTGESLSSIIQKFNMYFLSFNYNTELTRCQVPKNLRRRGLWITYIKQDKKVYTEWYNSDNIEDDYWKNSSNWKSFAINAITEEDNVINIGNSNTKEVIIAGKKIMFNSDGTCTWESV